MVILNNDTTLCELSSSVYLWFGYGVVIFQYFLNHGFLKFRLGQRRATDLEQLLFVSLSSYSRSPLLSHAVTSSVKHFPPRNSELR